MLGKKPPSVMQASVGSAYIEPPENGTDGSPANDKDQNQEIDRLRAEIAMEMKGKQTIDWTNNELTKSVMNMEKNILTLEGGNLEVDDNDVKQKFENQKQLNTQLEEQQKWLEDELEEIKLKIQNDKSHPLPDMLLNWDNLSEVEMKRLVMQLEKTRNDLKSDNREMEYRLDMEGQEFHRHNEFRKAYRAEVKGLTRTLDQLQKHGATQGVPWPGLPGNNINAVPFSGGTSGGIGDMPTPGGYMPGTYPPSRKFTEIVTSPTASRKFSGFSPPPGRKMMNSRSPSPNKSPVKNRKVAQDIPKFNPKLGAPRKTAGVRNLPKIEGKSARKEGQGSPERRRRNGDRKREGSRKGRESREEERKKAEEEFEDDEDSESLAMSAMRKSTSSLGLTDLDPVSESPQEENED